MITPRKPEGHWEPAMGGKKRDTKYSRGPTLCQNFLDDFVHETLEESHIM